MLYLRIDTENYYRVSSGSYSAALNSEGREHIFSASLEAPLNASLFFCARLPTFVVSKSNPSTLCWSFGYYIIH